MIGVVGAGIQRAVSACERKLGVKELEELVKALRQQISEKDSEVWLLMMMIVRWWWVYVDAQFMCSSRLLLCRLPC